MHEMQFICLCISCLSLYYCYAAVRWIERLSCNLVGHLQWCCNTSAADILIHTKASKTAPIKNLVDFILYFTRMCTLLCWLLQWQLLPAGPTKE